MLKTLALLGLATFAVAEPIEDRVYNLPLMNNDKNFPFKMYSGYLPIIGSAKNLHYLYVESQNDPKKDPVIIWFNGGPGCSSMLGFMQEHGPYVVENGGDTFHYNDYSWNKEANVLYLEAPAGVGFSYCLDKTECTFTDEQTGKDNLKAVLYWYEQKFPERKTNDLYLSGESYAGVYVPFLANEIDKYNTKYKDNDSVFKPNFKGFMVGNGVTNWKYDGDPAYIDMAYWRGLYGDDSLELIDEKGCRKQFEYMDLKENPEEDFSEDCQAFYNQWKVLTKDINEYNIYGYCYTAPKKSSLESSEDSKYGYIQVGNELKRYKKYATQSEYTNWKYSSKQKNLKSEPLQDTPPCTWGQPIIDYLNSIQVRNSLHIPKVAKAFDFCVSDDPNWDYTQNKDASQAIYVALKDKYRMLHYSGDSDGAVPTLGTQRWIEEVNWPITKAWTPYMVDGGLAGYYENRGKFTFMTMHGAGHMVPQDKRKESYHGIFNWLFDRPL